MEDLRDIRIQKGLSLSHLGAKTGIPKDLLQRYEDGEETIADDHLRRLARALFVDERSINPRSQPRPDQPELPAAVPPGKMIADQERRWVISPPEPRKRKEPPSPAHVRESQIAHMLGLAKRLGIVRAALEHELGKPLEELTRFEASRWLGEMQRRVMETQESLTPAAKRHRAHLPEAVDSFELNYLTELRLKGDPVTFTLFDGRTFTGPVIGFGTYVITIREQESGEELTLPKLALAYYQRHSATRDE